MIALLTLTRLASGSSYVRLAGSEKRGPFLPVFHPPARGMLDGRAEVLGPLLFYSCLGVKADCLK